MTAEWRRHAVWNGRASWLLAEVLDAAQKNQKNPFANDGLISSSEQLRAFEAALFMIGYDLGGGEVDTLKYQQEKAKSEEGAELEGWFVVA